MEWCSLRVRPPVWISERPDIGDQLQNSFLIDLSLISGHDRLEPIDDLRLRVEDGFPDVTFVGNYALAALEFPARAIQAGEIWAAALDLRAVTGAAAELLEQALSHGGHRAHSAGAGEPVLVISRLHYVDPANH